MNTKNIVLILVLFLVFGCKTKNQEAIPYVFVDFEINLNNPDFQNLQYDGGFVYVSGGYKGIVIYRENSVSYKAFERACTFQPTAECARISVDSSLIFMTDTCCGSQFDFSGNILSGPAPYTLKQYNTALDGNYLRVFN